MRVALTVAFVVCLERSVGSYAQRCDLRKEKQALQASCAPVSLVLLVIAIREKGDAEVASRPGRPPHRSSDPRASPIAQLVRAPH